jgi:hypothetical protein
MPRRSGARRDPADIDPYLQALPVRRDVTDFTILND